MKRFLSILLAILMLAVMLPVTAMAAEGDPTCVNGVWKNVDPNNVQALLDGKHGSIDNTTIELSAGDYSALTVGGVVDGTKGNLTYTCNHTDNTHYSYTDLNEYKNHLNDNSSFHWTSTYTRKISNVTFVANGDVTINGLLITSGHLDTTANPFRGGHTGYYLNQELKNFTFKGIKFVGNVDINTSSEETTISGFTFDGCSFTTNGTASSNGQALRYYNENNNGQVSDLTVKNCTFTNCHQGVYTSHIKNVTVKGCTFDTTGHNAIAIQDFKGTCDHGNVVITGNTFKNVGDRIIRFNNVGVGTTITISNNTSVNSGDSNGEIIKATTLPEGMEVTMTNDNWGKVGDKDPVIGNGFIETTTGGTIVIVPDRTEDTPKTEPEKNPTTGANDMVAAAVALMAVSTLGMAVLSRKK